MDLSIYRSMARVALDDGVLTASRGKTKTTNCFLLSTAGFVDAVSMTLFPTTVQSASSRVLKLICTGELPTTVISVVLVAVLHVFRGYLSALSPNILSKVKVEVAVLGSPSLTVLMVSAGVKQQGT